MLTHCECCWALYCQLYCLSSDEIIGSKCTENFVMEEGYERVYSCFACGTRHPKPTGKKCQVTRTKPASTVDLSDFMKEIQSLMATSSARMDKVESKLDSLAVNADVSTCENKNKSQYLPLQQEVDSDQCSEDEEVNQLICK